MLLADMSGADVAAIIVAISTVAAVVLLMIGLIAVTRTLTTIRMSVEQLRREILPVVEEASKTVANANAELERLDGLLTSAQGVTATVDSASHLLYLAVSNPLIKGVAIAAGAARAGRALRKREGR